MFGTPVTLHHYPGLPLDVFNDFVPSAAMRREHHDAALIDAALPGGWYIPAHLARLPGYSPMPGVYVEFLRGHHGDYDSDEESSSSSDFDYESDSDSSLDSQASTLVSSRVSSPSLDHNPGESPFRLPHLLHLLAHDVHRLETGDYRSPRPA